MKSTKRTIAALATTVITIPLALLFPTSSYADTENPTKEALTAEHAKNKATAKPVPVLSITIPILSHSFPKQISVPENITLDFTREPVVTVAKPVVKKEVAPAVEETVPPSPEKVEEGTVEEVKAPEKTSDVEEKPEVTRDDAGYGATDEYERFMPKSIEPMKDIDDKLVTIAATGKGKPYVWGGNTPDGWDCSGFVQWVYKNAGMDIPRVEQWTAGTVTTKPVPGDIVVQNGGSHVGIYAGGGMMYSALNPQDGTKFHPVNLFPSYFVHIER